MNETELFEVEKDDRVQRLMEYLSNELKKSEGKTLFKPELSDILGLSEEYKLLPTQIELLYEKVKKLRAEEISSYLDDMEDEYEELGCQLSSYQAIYDRYGFNERYNYERY